jgi:AsmA family/AsmA-like C-terminal region
MTTLRKWWKLAVALLLLLIVTQAGVTLLARTKRVHRYLTARLETAFGRPVEVEHFDAQILPRLRLDAIGLTVGEDPGFGYEYFLRAEKMSAGLRWMGFLRGHFDFGALSLNKPSLILVRGGEGHWNLERWLPPAKSRGGGASRTYGPPAAPAEPNRLQRIEFDEGRVNFKNGDDKLPFAFTGVSGYVEQVSSGRWQLHLEAQPWRSGVSLQSAGTVTVFGDIAGTSARLQPAEISVHWARASLADIFRLVRGQDYGIRGAFSLDAKAKSGEVAPNATADAGVADWVLELQASAAGMHRWDMTERADNPGLLLNVKGKWNAGNGSLNAEEVRLHAPKSNCVGMARLNFGTQPSAQIRIDSAGIQASDLLAWYRAFHPGVAEDVTADAFFTGGVTLRGWPLSVEQAGFSSAGAVVKLPGAMESVRIGAMRGGRERDKFVVEPVRFLLGNENASTAVAGSAKLGATSLSSKRKPITELKNEGQLGFVYDFESHAGSVLVNGRIDKAQDFLALTTVFGGTVNHGWELSGAASAAMRWTWTGSPLHGHWEGSVAVQDATLHAAGLNQPIDLDDARIEWSAQARFARFGKVQGFGATWSGEVSQMKTIEGDADAAWKFNLHADQLDAAELDRWVGPRARPGWLQRLLPSLLGGSAPALPASELLRRVNAEGDLQVDELTVEKLKLEGVRAHAELRDLRLEVTDAQAEFAGGAVHSTLTAKFSPKPSYELTAQIDNAQLVRLPGAGRLAERLDGIASAKLRLATGGVGREELLDKLAGTGTLKLKNVEFRGWDVSASVADGAVHEGTSRWTSGEGAFTIRERSFSLQDLELTGSRDARQLTLVRGAITFGRDANLSIQTTSLRKSTGRRTDDSYSGRVLTIFGPLDEPRVSMQKVAARAGGLP